MALVRYSDLIYLSSLQCAWDETKKKYFVMFKCIMDLLPTRLEDHFILKGNNFALVQLL